MRFVFTIALTYSRTHASLLANCPASKRRVTVSGELSTMAWQKGRESASHSSHFDARHEGRRLHVCGLPPGVGRVRVRFALELGNPATRAAARAVGDARERAYNTHDDARSESTTQRRSS